MILGSMRYGLALATLVTPAMLLPGAATAQNQQDPTIETLMKNGWTVAGYAAQGTTFILFKHESQPYLVQCSVLYDTTRGARTTERVKTNCYELH